MTSVRSFSLSQLLGSIRKCIDSTYTDKYWVRAETSDFRSAGSGHHYLELVERQEGGKQIRAKVRASIWSSTYPAIMRKLRQNGIEHLSSGMAILAQVQVTFHEQYGFNLIIWDIDPSYSLGDIARLRQETILRLKKEGLLDLNKTCPLRLPIQRVAIITSSTAAGYGDFMKQLHSHKSKTYCLTAVFTAIMQGEKTTESVIEALERILPYTDLFDAVVIIRGGGAVSELRAFDDYELCMVCANFPLPILSGIGHERDQSVLDLVAHTSLKTPTAVADFILQTQEEAFDKLEGLKERLINAYSMLSMNRQHELELIRQHLPRLAQSKIKEYRYDERELRNKLSRTAQYKLQNYKQAILQIESRLPILNKNLLQRYQKDLDYYKTRLKVPIANHLRRYQMEIQHWQQSIRLSEPTEILKRGFAIVKHNGKITTNASALEQGQNISIQLNRHTINAEVKQVVEDENK